MAKARKTTKEKSFLQRIGETVTHVKDALVEAKDAKVSEHELKHIAFRFLISRSLLRFDTSIHKPHVLH